MALDPLTAIAGPESSYGANTQNPTSSASGVWQDTSSTWQQASCAVGYCGVYATANDAPYSVQAAANAWLYNQRGFQPWTVGDPTLASDIQAAGGASAYAQPGTLSTNPASYAALDQAGGLQSYFANNGVSGVGTPTVSSPSGAGAVSNTGSTASGFAPYSYIWQEYSSAVVGALATEIGQVQHMVQGPVSAMLIVSLMMLGFGVMRGLLALDFFWRWVARIAVVISLVNPGSYYYETYVVGPFSGLPTWIAQQLSGYAGNNPAGIYDYLAAYIWNQAWHIWPSVPWSGAFLAALMLVIAVGVTWLGISVMFFVWLTAQALIGLVLVLGPVLILGLLFEFTRRIFNAFFEILIYLALVTLAADLMAGIFTQVISQAMNSMAQKNSTGSAAIESLSGIALVTLILAMAVAVMPYLLDRIGVGAAAANGMGAGHRWLIRNFYTRVGSAPPRLVSRRPNGGMRGDGLL